jgi:hypothetical protein
MLSNNLGGSLLFAVLFIGAVFGLLMLLAWLEQVPGPRREQVQRSLAPRRDEALPRHRRETPRKRAT